MMAQFQSLPKHTHILKIMETNSFQRSSYSVHVHKRSAFTEKRMVDNAKAVSCLTFQQGVIITHEVD